MKERFKSHDLVRIEQALGSPMRDDILMKQYTGSLGVIVSLTNYVTNNDVDAEWHTWNVLVDGNVEEFFADELCLIVKRHDDQSQ